MSNESKIIPDVKVTVGTAGPPIDGGVIPAPPALDGEYELHCEVKAPNPVRYFWDPV